MIFHEWHDRDEAADERRYFRAEKFGKKWKFKTTLKSDVDWEWLDPVPLDMLETLRALLQNKYQRRRVPYEDVVTVDRLVVEAGGGTIIDEVEK